MIGTLFCRNTGEDFFFREVFKALYNVQSRKGNVLKDIRHLHRAILLLL